MTLTPPSVAPLRNVTAFMELVQTLTDAEDGVERMACFRGPSGWGKTSAVGVVEVTYDAVVIEVPESVTKRFLMEKLCRTLGITRTRVAIPELVEKAAMQLIANPRPVVFDDAQYLMRSRDLIGLTRDLYNATAKIVPVILVGEEELPTRLSHIENLFNRISVWLSAEPCGTEDAAQLAQIYAPGLTIAPDLLARMVEASNGSARFVVNNLTRARTLAANRGVRAVDSALWGDRSFVTGAMPETRRPQDLKPRVRLTRPSAPAPAAPIREVKG